MIEFLNNPNMLAIPGFFDLMNINASVRVGNGRRVFPVHLRKELLLKEMNRLM